MACSITGADFPAYFAVIGCRYHKRKKIKKYYFNIFSSIKYFKK
jgi:hypothetical protein